MENTTNFDFDNISFKTDANLKVLNRKFRLSYQFDVVTHGIFLILGVFGNAVIIYTYSFRINKSRVDRYYILALAYVDCLLCIFCTSLLFTKDLNPLHFPNNATCKILLFFSNMFFTLSLLVLIVICIHRYRHICLSMSDTMTTKTKHTVIGVSTAVSVVFALPKLIYYKVLHIRFPNNITGRVCSSDMTLPGSEVLVSGVTVFLIITSIIGSILMTALYCLVARVIFKQLGQFKGMRIQKVRFRNLYGNLRASIINAFERENPNLSKRSSCETPVIHLENPSVKEENPKQRLEQVDNLNFEDVPKCDQQTLRKKSSRNRNKTKTKSLAVYLSANRKARRSTLMFIAVTIVTVFSYIPTWTYAFLDARDPSRWFQMSSEAFHFFVFLRSLGALGYLTHPWIYAYYDKCFQREIKHFFCRRIQHPMKFNDIRF